MVRGVRRGCVRLKGAMIGIDDEDNLTFTVTVDGKTFHFQARTRADRELWIRALEDTIQKQLYGYRVNQIQVDNELHKYFVILYNSININILLYP